MTTDTLGRRVARRRAALKLTRQSLAAKCGCAEGTIMRIEKDTVKPSHEMLLSLRSALGLSLDDLAGVTRSKTRRA